MIKHKKLDNEKLMDFVREVLNDTILEEIIENSDCYITYVDSDITGLINPLETQLTLKIEINIKERKHNE